MADGGLGSGDPYEFLNATDGQLYTLPMSEGTQLHFDGNYTSAAVGTLLRVDLQNDLIYDYRNGGLGTASDDIAYRILYYAPTTLSDMFDGTLNYHDSTTGAGSKQATGKPATESRKFYQDDDGDPNAAHGGAPTAGQINATYPDFTVSTVQSNDADRRVQVIDSSRTAGTIPAQSGNYLIHMGAVMYVSGKTNGVYLQRLGDNSWSLDGYGTASAPDTANPKRVTDAMISRYIDITTIDPAQPSCVVVAPANENGFTKAQFKAQCEAVVTRFDAAFADAGLPAPHYLFWHHFNAPARTEAEHETYGEALEEAARAGSRRSFVSTYAITDGIEMTGGADAIAWVANNGYASVALGSNTYNWSGADFVDADNVHPDGSVDGNDAFAYFTSREIEHAIDNAGSFRGRPSRARVSR